MMSSHNKLLNTGFDLSREVHAHIERAFLGAEVGLTDNRIHAAYLHHFNQAGNGTRMKVAFHCSTFLNIPIGTSCRLAACVECLHNASLIQDDLQDQSVIRRGQESVAAKFGRDVALGLTNRLMSAAFVCACVDVPSTTLQALMARLHEAISETVEGQTGEMLSRSQPLSFESRMAISGKKSGPFFALALELPLIVAGYQELLPEAHQAGIRFGLGYQILDDLQDQEDDSKIEGGGNLVLTMKAQCLHLDQSPESYATQLAHNLLHDAAEQAGRLPHRCGTPLMELVQMHLPLLCDGPK